MDLISSSDRYIDSMILLLLFCWAELVFHGPVDMIEVILFFQQRCRQDDRRDNNLRRMSSSFEPGKVGLGKNKSL